MFDFAICTGQMKREIDAKTAANLWWRDEKDREAILSVVTGMTPSEAIVYARDVTSYLDADDALLFLSELATELDEGGY